MSFSQGWDAGFKSLLIYLGIIFSWLIFVESELPSQMVSVIVMNLVAVMAAGGYFIRRRRVCIHEQQQAEAEVERILAEVD